MAKDFGLPTKTITEILTKYVAAPKNHMQVLNDHELSVIFDYLSFKTFEDAFIALNRNGFDLYFENYSEGDINVYDYGLRPPRRRFEIEEHPLFSQGDQWS